MNGYVCVYRHVDRPRRHIHITAQADHPLIKEYLAEYTSEASYLDWGDDPAFFSARKYSAIRAWPLGGVCRPNVRSHLEKGDFVVFFCAKPEGGQKSVRYYFIGVGTVHDVITREELWSDDQYEHYRSFLNVLARVQGSPPERHEACYPGHPTDWLRRMDHYVLFSRPHSYFNLTSPLHVATYRGELPEKWRSAHSAVVARVEQLLFDEALGKYRRLRTAHSYRAHSHLNLGRVLPNADLAQLRSALLQIARAQPTTTSIQASKHRQSLRARSSSC